MRPVRLLLAIVLCSHIVSAAADKSVPTPAQYLKLEIGADRVLADYHQITTYFKMLAAVSPRIQIQKLGVTTLGNEMIMAVISSEENLRNVEHYKEMSRRIADPRGLAPDQINALIRDARVVLLVTANIHASEIGASQMVMEWAHALVAAEDAETRRWLNEVILLVVPSLNPDGQIMEVEWYRKYLGTPYEGGRMPWLYHHYVGHDNNRDWYMLTQKETRAASRAIYHEWLPQVWLDEHQMGLNGPRMFAPPPTDPISPNIHPMIWRCASLFGSGIAWRLEEQRKQGLIYGWTFDNYAPGGKDTTLWKNVCGLLTEVASVRLATPVDIPASELTGGRKGLIEYKVQANFPNPWAGGHWRLRDIMDYERIASDAALEVTADHRQDLLRAAARMAQDAVDAGRLDEYWRIPVAQHDPVTAAKLAHLLREHGVEVKVASNASRLEFFIPTAQPYHQFLTEMLNPQRYPGVRVQEGGEILAPYDITAWSLPLLMGVDVGKTRLTPDERRRLRNITDSDWPQGGTEASGPVYAVLRQTNSTAALVNALLRINAQIRVATATFEEANVVYPPGTLLVSHTSELAALAQKHHVKAVALLGAPAVAAQRLRQVRIGLYKPWLASVDEGWTRWILEQYGFDFKSVENKDIKAGNLNAQFDAIILPDITKTGILEGRLRAEAYAEELPPEYRGGIGQEGVKALKDFAANGGTVIALADAGILLADEFNIPVRNVLAGLRGSDFSCPGSLLRAKIDTNHPINYGMPPEAAIFVDRPLAWQTSAGAPGLDRSVLASYPEQPEDILVSGYLRGADRLQRRAAAVSLSYGKGKLVMFGFRVQHRAQTEGTFKMLFNAIYWAGMEPGE